MEKQMDVMEAFYAEVKEREKYYWEFNLPLTDDLFVQALRYNPQLATLPEIKRKELYMRAFFRAGEICNFMMERILDDEDDADIDLQKMKVPGREELANNNENEFLYTCFEIAKKKLWICFPGMSEFSGNSLIYMNRWTYDCTQKFVEQTKELINTGLT